MSRSPFTASLLVVAVAVAACTPKADLVIQGGSVWTGLSTGRGVPGTVAIANGKILAVGDSAEVARYVGAQTRVLRADGGLVVPGLADGHTHFIDGGFQLASVDLRDAATPEEFIRRLKEYAATLQPGEWITGGDWDHELWRGTPLPQRDWIDSVTPNNPVFVNRLDGHMALANGAALRAAAVTRATATPAGGEVVRDATGEPLGVFKDQAMDLVWRA
ncbi:MAG TPA: amidohydrolase family protein [Gemmatimonadales bacterium]|nr:amidohydrolase family protein [Gemmatimonadales bacterium]